MSILKAAGVLLLLAIGAGAFFLERQSNAQLREEVALLRGEVQQLAQQQQRAAAQKAPPAPPAVASAQAEADRAELAKLRDEVEALKTRAKEFGQAAQALKAAAAAAGGGGGKPPADAIPVKLVPVTEWKNAGRATVNSAVETVLWAASGGDVDLLSGALEFTDSARAKAQALFDHLPDGARQEYGSPEKLMALMLAKDAGKVASMQILGQRELSPDNVGVRLRVGNDLGQTKDQGLLMHKAADGWKLMLTDDPVEKFAKQLAGKK